MKAVWISFLIYIASLVLLAKASSLMYLTSKAPNFSLGHIMILGAYSGSLFIKVIGLSPFITVFVTALFTGIIIGLLESLLIIEPLIKKGRSPIFISLSTIGAGLVLQGFLHIVHDWIWLHFPSFRSYIQYRIFLREYDIEIYGISGSLLISMFTASLIVLLFWYLVEFTLFGTVFRGLSENNQLIEIQGYDPVLIRIVIWSVAGGVAGLAGAFHSMWFHTMFSTSYYMLTSIFAASLIGGFDNPKAAVFGGIIVGFSEIIGTTRMQALMGAWVGEWRAFIPLFYISLIMGLRPQGFFGRDLKELNQGKRYLTRRQLFTVFVILILGFSVFDISCRANLSRTRNSLFHEFSEYELVLMEDDIDEAGYSCNSLSSFKAYLVQYNISTVYFEPFSDIDRHLSFYFNRTSGIYRIDIFIESYGLCQYRYEIN